MLGASDRVCLMQFPRSRSVYQGHTLRLGPSAVHPVTQDTGMSPLPAGSQYIPCNICLQEYQLLLAATTRALLRGFAKLKKFQKSKNNLDRAQPTHPPPYPNILFCWKPISGLARTLKSQLLITYRQNTSYYAHTT